MKINRWMIIGSAILSVFGLGAILISPIDIIVNIGISLLSGGIVSIVSSTLYYSYEKQRIIFSIKQTLPLLYLDLSVLKIMTGEILQKIIYTQDLSSLRYDRLNVLTNDCIFRIDNCSINSYSGIFTKGKISCGIKQFKEIMIDLRNLRSNLVNLEYYVLKVSNYNYNLNMKTQYGQTITQEDNQKLYENRNSVNIRTAKIEEYEASLIIKLDNVASCFYIKKNESWEDVKRIVDKSAIKIVDNSKF